MRFPQLRNVDLRIVKRLPGESGMRAEANYTDQGKFSFKARNRDLFNLVYEWEGEASYRLEAYDPARPRFGSFEKTYRGRPFPFRLAVSDLLQAQVENLLAKDPPVSRRQRLSRWGRALLNTAWRRRP